MKQHGAYFKSWVFAFCPPLQDLPLFDLWIWRPSLIISLEQLPEAMLPRSQMLRAALLGFG